MFSVQPKLATVIERVDALTSYTLSSAVVLAVSLANITTLSFVCCASFARSSNILLQSATNRVIQSVAL